MQAVLFVCHGSRVKEAGSQAKAFVEKCMESMGDIPIKEVCFLELSEPSIKDGFLRCVEQGATRITVMPVLLLTAAHAKHDIPEEINVVQQAFPEVTVTYGETFGVNEKIISILLERVKAKGTIGEDAMVLLVGRGSSDPDSRRDFGRISSALYETTLFQSVETCFLAAITPTFHDGLEIARQKGHKQVFVLPYLLFTGLLMKGMEREMKTFRSENQEFILCDYLGYHPLLEQVLVDRTREAVAEGVLL